VGTYIYYNKILVATFDEGQLTADGEGIERSGMPSQWVPHIQRLLENALPEGLRRDTLVRLAARQGKTAHHPIELIPYVADLPGDFSASHSHASCENGNDIRRFSPLPEKLSPDVIESRLSPTFFDPLSEPRLNERPSFSGYQDKFTAHLIVEGDKLLLLPVRQENERGNVIVKPAHLKYPFIAENEYICMMLARRSGLPTPRVFLFQQPDLPLPRQNIAVERFDVRIVEGQAQMLNIAEFASLMGLVSDQKYDPTTEDLFVYASRVLPDEDVKTLAKAYLLGAIVRNGDMHAKNFSVSIEDNIPRLTPIYDMVNTEVYGISDVLALKLMNTNSPKTQDIAHFLLNYLTPKEMAEMTDVVKEHLQSCVEVAFGGAPSHQNLQKFRKRLEQSISGGATRMQDALQKITRFGNSSQREMTFPLKVLAKGSQGIAGIPGVEDLWETVEALHKRGFLTDNALALSGETLIPLKYGEYRDIAAMCLVTNDWGGYNQAKQLAKEISIQGVVAEESAKEFSFEMRGADESPVRIRVTNEERLRLTTESFQGVPVLDEKSLLAQNILHHKEKGSDLEKNARDTVDLVALSGAVAPELVEEAIQAANEVSTSKIREVRDLVKSADLDKALEKVQGVTTAAKDMLKDRYAKTQTRERGVGITD
jgi:hypothetical protein